MCVLMPCQEVDVGNSFRGPTGGYFPANHRARYEDRLASSGHIMVVRVRSVGKAYLYSTFRGRRWRWDCRGRLDTVAGTARCSSLPEVEGPQTRRH
jgi:hypothetical protein